MNDGGTANVNLAGRDGTLDGRPAFEESFTGLMEMCWDAQVQASIVPTISKFIIGF